MQRINLKQKLEEEREQRKAYYIEMALRATKGDVRAAAKKLTVGERTLWRWLKSLGIDPGQFAEVST